MNVLKINILKYSKVIFRQDSEPIVIYKDTTQQKTEDGEPGLGEESKIFHAKVSQKRNFSRIYKKLLILIAI